MLCACLALLLSVVFEWCCWCLFGGASVWWLSFGVVHVCLLVFVLYRVCLLLCACVVFVLFVLADLWLGFGLAWPGLALQATTTTNRKQKRTYTREVKQHTKHTHDTNNNINNNNNTNNIHSNTNGTH